MKKITLRPQDYLLVLLIFHLVGNILWLSLNNTPPAWDEAVHTKFSIKFLHVIENSFSGTISLAQLRDAMFDYYGPLVRVLTALILFVFVPSIKLAQFTGTLFFLASLIVLFKLGSLIFQDEWKGLLTAFIFSFYHVIYDNSRWLLLDIPLTFFILTSIYFLLSSNFFEKRREGVLALLFLFLGMVTKFQCVLYFIIPFLYALGVILKKKDKNRFHNLLYAGLIFGTIIAAWGAINFKSLLTYYSIVVKPEPFADPNNLLDPTTWLHYLKLFIDYEMSFFIFLWFIPFAYYYLRSKAKYKTFIVLNVMFYYIFFTVFPNKDMRYLFPVLPLTALIFAGGFFELYKKKPFIANIALSTVVSFNVISYLSLSFGLIFPKGLRKQIDLPYIKDIVYLNLTDYPVRKFNPNSWPIEKMIHDMELEVKGKRMDLVFIPNYDNFNDNTVSLYLTYQKVENINLMRSGGKRRFNSEQEVKDFVDSYVYFLYTPNEVGVFYQPDKEAFEQIQAYVGILLSEKKAQILKQYLLPTGQKIYFVKRLVI